MTNEIPQRQKAEAELQSTFHQTDRVLEAVPSILIVLDAQNTVIWWNMAAEQTLGIAANDIIGHSLQACATLWEIPALRQSLAIYATKKEKVILEDFSIQASDGAKRILGLTI
ncbi:MAG TPA: PAS domain-containing protein, partial [Gammaproteobacteria bacterium]|nr:PAS domain-containing protein [Gammaproteobacteria bacterium]